MNTKVLSERAISVIDQYLHFKVGNAVTRVPYLNNKTTRSRAALRVLIGKGSPKDILDEINSKLVKSHVASDVLSDEALNKLLVDNNIGIDCSGFAYYVLNAENEELGKDSLSKHLKLIKCHGLIGKIRCALRPIENCGVETFASDQNSKIISLNEIQPGDMITMLDCADSSERDHILVIHQVEYQNFIPTKIHYSHAISYPEDGVYGTGTRQGVIEIINQGKNLLEQKWIEEGKEGEANRLLICAKKSKTEIRKLKWW